MTNEGEKCHLCRGTGKSNLNAEVQCLRCEGSGMETGQVAVTPEEDFTLNLDELSDEALKKMRPEQIRELIAKLQARRPELMKGAGKVGPGSKKGRSKKGRSKKAEPEVLL